MFIDADEGDDNGEAGYPVSERPLASDETNLSRSPPANADLQELAHSIYCSVLIQSYLGL